MVVTLRAGNVMVSVEPEAGMVPAATGETGLPPEDWLAAVEVVIW